MKRIFTFPIAPLLAYLIIWYFFGTVTFKATVNDHELINATVYADGKYLCETPCSTRLFPGNTHFKISPPPGLTFRESYHIVDFFTIVLGGEVEVKFHDLEFDVPDDHY